MTTVNLNQSAYDSLPLADHQQREAPNHIFISPTNLDATSSLSCPSSTSCKFQDSPSASHIGKQRWHDQEEDNKDDWSRFCGPNKCEKDKEEINRSSDKYSSSSSSSASEKWKCSDGMGLMQKMGLESNSPTCQHIARREGSSNSIIKRVCADCNTTSTPLWRSGPNGPKSLCNACGIRQRKARKAMEEGAWCANNNATRIKHNNKEKKRQVIKNQSQSRRRRIEFTIRRNSVVFQRPLFPRDEVLEGAWLLMDLSCGFFSF